MNASFIEVCYISEKFGAQIWFKNYFLCFANENKQTPLAEKFTFQNCWYNLTLICNDRQWWYLERGTIKPNGRHSSLFRFIPTGAWPRKILKSASLGLVTSTHWIFYSTICSCTHNVFQIDDDLDAIIYFYSRSNRTNSALTHTQIIV